MRVAVAQFATSINVEENLASCIRVIDEAAVCKPSLLILPEFCNTFFSNTFISNTQCSDEQCSNEQFSNEQFTYVDHNQAWQQALSIDGPFLQRIAAQAKKHNCYIVLNVTLRRELARDFSNKEQNDSNKSNISITSCLFSPLGKLIHQADKQSLIGHENNFFIGARKASEVVTTPFGKLGLLTASDTFEPSRELALHGAQLLCNSIAIGQNSRHGPARASENNVFLATASKIEPSARQENNYQEMVVGTGQSQIISPDGKVVAEIYNNEEGYVFADINLLDVKAETEIGLSQKHRPDGTQLNKQLRPELYQQLTACVKDQQALDINKVPVTANVAIFATYKSDEEAIEDVCHYIENNVSDIIQLPELFFIADKTITNDAVQRAQIAHLGTQLIKKISTVLRPFQYVCTSLVIEGIHQAVLISEHGLLAIQQQLHFCKRYQWTTLGDDLNIIELPLEQGNINLAMLTADDANIPELVKAATQHNIHLLLVPFDIQEPCEVEHSLLARATENRICIVAASREKNFDIDAPNNTDINKSDFAKNGTSQSNTGKKNIYAKNKVKRQKSTGLIINLARTVSPSTTRGSGKSDGYINQLIVKHQHGKITKAVVHPSATCNKG